MGVRCLVALLLLASSARAGDFAGLTPGRSTAEDAKRVLGRCTVRGSTLTFGGDWFGAKTIRVEVDEAQTILSIAILPQTPPRLEKLRGWLALGEPILKESSGEEELLLFLPQLVQLRVQKGIAREVTHLAPRLAWARVRSVAESRLRNGDRDGAAQLLKALASADGDDSDAAVALAESLHETGDDLAALDAVRKGLDAAPGSEVGELLKVFVEGAIETCLPAWIGVRMHGEKVAHVFADTPAARAGILVGDEVADLEEGSIDLRLDREVSLPILRNGTRSLVSLVPIDREAYFASHPSEEIQTLAERGRLAEAFRRLETDPARHRSAELQAEFARIAARIDIERGVAEWKRALALGAVEARGELDRLEIALPLHLKARQWEEAGRFTDAADLYGSIALPSFDLHFRLGCCLKRLRQFGRAATAFRRATRLWPDEPVAWYDLSECCEAFDLARARAACVAFLRRVRGRGAAAELEAKAVARKTRLETAMARKILGDRAAASGLWKQALADYEHASVSAPLSVELLRDRTRAMMELGNCEGAFALCRQALEMGGTPVGAALGALLGDHQHETGQFTEAAALYKRAWESAPDEVGYLYRWAWEVMRYDPRASVGIWRTYLDRSRDNAGERPRRQAAEECLKLLMK